ncbi:unnamed protein product [Darwinula stevensoni]|uniref:Uncharacterized protein n=1 Tax=Darwinula stevensoni TaxID=69355 RepID=A0A7R8X312_9CRUS|nr:unnamed protein product [Darwinula stevensoni]CAG0884001.1 unnamed protein product [Darwinula stevensoni]
MLRCHDSGQMGEGSGVRGRITKVLWPREGPIEACRLLHPSCDRETSEEQSARPAVVVGRPGDPKGFRVDPLLPPTKGPYACVRPPDRRELPRRLADRMAFVGFSWRMASSPASGSQFDRGHAFERRGKRIRGFPASRASDREECVDRVGRVIAGADRSRDGMELASDAIPPPIAYEASRPRKDDEGVPRKQEDIEVIAANEEVALYHSLDPPAGMSLESLGMLPTIRDGSREAPTTEESLETYGSVGTQSHQSDSGPTETGLSTQTLGTAMRSFRTIQSRNGKPRRSTYAVKDDGKSCAVILSDGSEESCENATEPASFSRVLDEEDPEKTCYLNVSLPLKKRAWLWQCTAVVNSTHLISNNSIVKYLKENVSGKDLPVTRDGKAERASDQIIRVSWRQSAIGDCISKYTIVAHPAISIEASFQDAEVEGDDETLRASLSVVDDRPPPMGHLYFPQRSSCHCFNRISF